MNELMSIELISEPGPIKSVSQGNYHTSPANPPCDTCPCEWVCAGASQVGDKPNWTLAMACSKFRQYTTPVKAEQRKMKNVNQMPSRDVYVQMFG